MGNFRLKTKENPNGYNAGTWEYIVTSDDGIVWSNGGYHSEQDARQAGRELITQLEADG